MEIYLNIVLKLLIYCKQSKTKQFFEVLYTHRMKKILTPIGQNSRKTR